MTPWTIARQVPLPWNCPGENIGLDTHSLLQGIFLIQGSNPGLLHRRWILYHCPLLGLGLCAPGPAGGSLCCLPRPCSVLAGPRGLYPSCPRGGPSGCFCPLEMSSFKEGSRSRISLRECSVPGPGASGTKPASWPLPPRQTQGWSRKDMHPFLTRPTDLLGKGALRHD